MCGSRVRKADALWKTSSRRSACCTAARERYSSYMKTTVSSKGQIVLPAEFRQMDRVEQGQEFEVERIAYGEYRLARRTPRQNEGAIDWLLVCPEKDYFVPIESEPTDEL